MSPMVQASNWSPTDPVIEQADPVWDWMLQSTPGSAGKGSLTVTLVAVPVPVLDTVIVNPTLAPGLTGVASAVLVIARLGWEGGGMVSNAQRSPASPPGLFWSPSWVMTWNRYVWPGTSGKPFSSWSPLTFQRTSAPKPSSTPRAPNPPVGVSAP